MCRVIACWFLSEVLGENLTYLGPRPKSAESRGAWQKGFVYWRLYKVELPSYIIIGITPTITIYETCSCIHAHFKPLTT